MRRILIPNSCEMADRVAVLSFAILQFYLIIDSALVAEKSSRVTDVNSSTS